MANTPRQRYRRLLDGLALKHFTSGEVIRYADSVRDGVRNSLPPEGLWLHLVPTLWVLDQLRGYFGEPITLISIYRSPSYNAAVKGSDGSFHKQNRAIDFTVRNVSPAVAFNRLVKFRRAGVFRGGLGRYNASGFVHMDTRGYSATWYGS